MDEESRQGSEDQNKNLLGRSLSIYIFVIKKTWCD